MKYKMAILDIDGTISFQGNNVSKAVVDAVRELDKRSIPVCLCTGRNVASALPVMERLGLYNPFSTVDGIITFCPKGKRELFSHKLDTGIMGEIAGILRDKRAYVEAVTSERYYKYIQNAPDFDYHYGFLHPCVYVHNFAEIEAVIPDTIQYIIGGGKGVLQEIASLVKAKFGDLVGMRDNLWDGYIFIGPPGMGKSLGMRNLCGYFNVDVSEVVAIGDDVNDLDLLAQAGMGVAMGNGAQRAKDVADYITSTVWEDGAAKALRKFFLTGHDPIAGKGKQ